MNPISVKDFFQYLALTLFLVFYWSCAPSPDTTPPEVVGVHPENASFDIVTNIRPEISFSENIEPSSITGTTEGECVGSVQLSRNDFEDCIITTLSVSGAKLTISPNDNLSLVSEYKIKLTTGIKDQSGNALAGDFITSFTTSTPPKVIKIQPDNLSLAVDITTNPKITFSETLDNSSINGTIDRNCLGSVQLADADGGCIGVVLSLSENILTISPIDNLSLGMSYSVTLLPEIKDLAGNELGGNFLSKFTTEITPGLADTSSSRLMENLEPIGLSQNQTYKIITAGLAQLVTDNLSLSEDPSLVLPSILAGSLVGVGEANLGQDNLTIQVIKETTKTIISLIGEFEEKLVISAKLSRQADAKAAFENLLENLISTAATGLSKTGLSEEMLDEGFGEVVGAVIGSLDDAQTETEEIASATQVVLQKAIQKTSSISGMEPTAGIQSITKSAIEAVGDTRLDAIQVTSELSAIVKTIIESLDEVEGNPSWDLPTLISGVTNSSLAGLKDLQNTFQNDDLFQVEIAFQQIAQGAIKGSGELAASGSSVDLTSTIANLSKEIAASIELFTEDTSEIADIVQKLQMQIDLEIDAIEAEHPSVYVDEYSVKYSVANSLREGLTQSGLSAWDSIVFVTFPVPITTSEPSSGNTNSVNPIENEYCFIVEFPGPIKTCESSNGNTNDSSSSDSSVTTTKTTVLTGSVTASTGSVANGRSKRNALAIGEMQSCLIEAYDMEDKKVAETQADEDNNYSFDDGDLELGVDYKIVSNCSYNGQENVKMSSYARTIPNKSAVPSPVEVNPKTTAIAVMIRKAIVSAISTAESTLGMDLFDVKVAILSSVSSIIDDMATSLAEDPTFVFPEDPLEASATEKTITASLNLSEFTAQDLSDSMNAMDSITNDESWDVTNAEAKIEASKAAGKQALVCGVNAEDDGTEAAKCSQVLFELFAAKVGWSVSLDLGDQESHWFGKSCNQDNLTLPASNYTYLQVNNECLVTPKQKVINKYGKEEWRFLITGQALQAISTNLKKDTKYSLKDTNNVIFKNDNVSGGEDTGLGGWLSLNIYTGDYRGSYYYDDEWVKHDHRSIDSWVYEEQQYKPFVGFSEFNYMAERYQGPVPTFEEIYAYIDNSTYHTHFSEIESTYWSMTTVNPPWQDENCDDRDARTPCFTSDGTNINDLVYQIGVEWEISETGKLIIKSLGKAFEKTTKSKKNYELFERTREFSDIGVDLFELRHPGTGGRSVKDTDDSDIAFHFVHDRNGSLSCPNLEDSVGNSLVCNDNASFVQINFRLVDGEDEIFETPGFSAKSTNIDNDTKNVLYNFSSDGWGNGDLDHPLWTPEMDQIEITDYDNSGRKTFSEFDNFVRWALKGASKLNLSEDDRLHRCSFWKNTKLSEEFDNTSREICLNRNSQGYANYTLDYYQESRDDNNDKSVEYPDFLSIDNVSFRERTYRYSSNQLPLALWDYAFPRDIFGKDTWDETTGFNSAQVVSLVMAALFENSNYTTPQNGLESYFNPQTQLAQSELKLSRRGIVFPAFGKDQAGPYTVWNQFANFLNHPERLRD